MIRWGLRIRSIVPFLLLCGGIAAAGAGGPTRIRPDPAESKNDYQAIRRFAELHCVSCHDADEKAGGLVLAPMLAEDLTKNSKAWEKVVRRVAARQMPPAEEVLPSEHASDAFVTRLSEVLDRAAAESPNPGRVATFRRLNRSEYRNAIRDLLALDIDASALLPGDESSHGFDNVTVGDLSPTLLDRLITASQKISRLAVGGTGKTPGGDTFRIKADLTQEEHVESLPIGTRGGTVIPYLFPQGGEYEVQILLARDRNEHVEGLREPHELDVLIDRERKATFTLKPPKSDLEHQNADAHLKARIKVGAGPRKLGVTFLKTPSSLLETKRQPYQAHYNAHRHPRIGPALLQVSITGPYEPEGPGDTPSRRRIFTARQEGEGDEEYAGRILSTLLRRAYRRPTTEADLRKPMAMYREARAEGGFDAGIEMALSAILVNPQFLFRIEADPPGLAPGTVYPVSDVQLASRLSFFLWGSIPDDTLLDLAGRDELSKPAVLEGQVRRMLIDPRSRNLVENFAAQWLHLRNLDSITPDLRLFPDFDDNLRQAFRRETELLFEGVMREDRSVLDLLDPGHTFMNERLAKHYGIPHIYGSHFRRVELGKESTRGGLLRQGSVLTVTSYATRTSPVIRGKWILENLLGTPLPAQPPDVPALKEVTVSASLRGRERLAEHRANVACATCHNVMDPVGLALENFDAVGRWRDVEDGRPVDASGGMPDGSRFDGVAGLEQAMRDRPGVFVGTLAEKLLTFALGRGVEHFDAPAIRKIVRDAHANNDTFSSLIVGISTSTPFLFRRSE
jgi:hypothetical protein